jgi:inhibitor of cysteine peptidase
MVQKEVMKKTRSYGLIAILLAAMLVAMIYSYGTTPGNNPILPFPEITPTAPPYSQGEAPNPSVNPSNNPTNPSPVPSASPEPEMTPMMTFSSYQDLNNYLNSSNSNSGIYYGIGSDFRTTGLPVPAPVPSVPPTASVSSESQTKDFSTTNIQVAGVDEADTVKTDGKYLYVIGNNSQVVYIIDANPQNAKVLSKIFLNNTNLSGVYLSQDGNKIAVLGNQYSYAPSRETKEYGDPVTDLIMPYWSSSTTFVNIYDVSNKANPTLTRNFTMTGNYVNSRMIGNYIYDIITESAYLVNDAAILPTVFSGNQASNVNPTEIYYAKTSDSYYTYTTITCLNIMNDASPISNMTIMMGGTGTIYVSQSNIYITYPQTEYETVTQTTPTPLSTEQIKNDTITILPMPIMIRPVWQGTSIYRVHVAEDKMTFAAQGNVTGNVLNQYAMDENNGYFRIVTTSYDYNSDSWWSGTQQNNVYTLDMSLKLVGKLENLGTGENFHSARFMGNRLYMVTYQKTDPLFVIDLSQPTNPKLLGELIIPGYSDYLHPYDETHLIGLGKDAVVDEGSDFAWYQGLKLSIFDVTNVNSPVEMAKYIIGDRGTNSEALYEPKAFLFDKSKNLLFLPVDLYLIDRTTTPTPIPTRVPENSGTSTPSILPMPPIGSGSSEYGQFVWQGVYIFNVSLDGGIVLKGNVTQMDNPQALINNPSLIIRSNYPYFDYNHFISRSLYIGNTLYTFSQSRVQLNSLDNFALIAKIDLN